MKIQDVREAAQNAYRMGFDAGKSAAADKVRDLTADFSMHGSIDNANPFKEMELSIRTLICPMSDARQAALTPPADGDKGRNAVLEDAERWRALISSERVTAMGWSGFNTTTAAPKAHDEYLHVTLNFWNKHPPDEGWQAVHGRKMLLAYVDGIRALKSTPSPSLEQEREREK